MTLITAQYSNMPVLFQSDAFINATAIAKQFNKVPKDFLRTDSTKEYITAIGQICLLEQNQLVKVKNGGNPQEVGTWFHPKLAVPFARWLDVRFAVWCDMQIEKILHSKPDLPDFLKPVTDPISYETYTERRDLLTHHLALLKKAPVNITVSAETAEEIKTPLQAQAAIPCVDTNINETIVTRQAFEAALAQFLAIKKASGSQTGSVKTLRSKYRKEFAETGKIPPIILDIETRGRHSIVPSAVITRFEELATQSADKTNPHTFIPWELRKITLLHSILEDEFKFPIPIMSLYRHVKRTKSLKQCFQNEKAGV